MQEGCNASVHNLRTQGECVDAHGTCEQPGMSVQREYDFDAWWSLTSLSPQQSTHAMAAHSLPGVRLILPLPGMNAAAVCMCH